MGIDNRYSITDAAKSIGVTPRTIMRWEKVNKIKKPKRDWRGWRFYHKEDIEEIKKFYETSYEYDENNGAKAELAKVLSGIVIAAATAVSMIYGLCYASDDAAGNSGEPQVIAKASAADNIDLASLPVAGAPIAHDDGEAVKYTLGPDDVISIDVRRHPEFSGQYAVNSEGKIEYKFVGDIVVSGLTKVQLKDKLTKTLSEFVVEPDIDVQIVAYLSKIFYVVGEVNKPGKFYMRGDTIAVREALVQAGLPTEGAAMRRCRLITPNSTGRHNYKDVDVYSLLYKGDLRRNTVMKSGDVLYIPSTVMAKLFRVISPVSKPVAETAGTAAAGAALVP